MLEKCPEASIETKIYRKTDGRTNTLSDKSVEERILRFFPIILRKENLFSNSPWNLSGGSLYRYSVHIKDILAGRQNAGLFTIMRRVLKNT